MKVILVAVLVLSIMLHNPHQQLDTSTQLYWNCGLVIISEQRSSFLLSFQLRKLLLNHYMI